MLKKQLLTRIFSEDINKFFFACGILLIIIIKFFLIRNSEVLGHPRDCLLYTLMADQNIWFPANKAKAIIDYMPGYPIFIMVSNFLNFPLRISHEIFYTISNILLVFSFRLLKIPRYICLVIFAILTFHITTFMVFNTIVTETIAISLYHILLALTIITVMSENLAKKLIFSVLGGLCLGIIFITRPEQIVFLLSYLVVFVILVLRNRMNIARAIREALPICIIPIAISLLITTVFTLLNAFFLELPALSISNSSAFKETFSQIQSIDDGQNIDDFEFVNINRKQLKMAYQVSPTLNQVKSLIEEELARKVTTLGGKDTNIEVTIDWVHWSTIEAIRRSNLTEDRSMYQVFTQINSELQEAFNYQIINRKTFSFDPIDIGFWLNKFPHSLTKMSGYLFLPRVSNRFLQNTDDPRVTPEMRSIFNRVAHRRTYLVNQRDLNKDLIFYLNRLRITPLIQIINIIGMISFVILFVYYLIKPVHSQLLNQYVLIISFALSIILLRLFLYVAVDMAFFPGDSRYLFPSNPLLSALSILNLYVTTKLLRSFRFSA
ncbi:MAG: hypothetical protein EWV53_14860 [Microcystis panniformis Mp_MB_F_20051200_S9]|uniref:Glycosyltransferase RgtA/B/C/D-like domain-containing protein n=1 Tax=Microcystis panniformis Mp_MB_F_20051200_S9 TaxID=2486223 RepID=A0A552PTM0_9CHRO|nr:MAG: hypothetical protein EWV43_21105 [Microcystis panniformis Mp_MB_F_20080800_S26D]TRV45092.1 MAG: hypothetical protein EWV42_20550 [Microcystis panniformis Mp_GB_SS_20050300_S99D]TRV45592.1 MAG: hypothetical protein EWV87_17350 [Microcystis panniformis Mp_GB_SS_20050300_S99]TRV55174.1 MAG: hypothetical protein EWV69_20825 [Microcystis panniformis Mp_MB_F_20080800_S26]TRV60338.1 MAG: hypothetical protein EWV53_14860 [Microcystis panniformis Mp_MB_F_20051200_S9]TRV66651.1 MAG: hypothetical